MRILFIGDIFGRPGRTIVKDRLPGLVREHAVDLIIANGENAAAGFGITPSLAEDLFELGIDVITTGNHIWDKREIVEYFESADGTSIVRRAGCCVPRIIPQECPAGASMKGVKASRIMPSSICRAACSWPRMMIRFAPPIS